MALALNTSDPLYSSLSYLFAVDDDNTVKELRAGLALTVDATVRLPNSASSPSTTTPFGRSFRPVGNGSFNFLGVTFTNQVVPTTAPV